MNPLLLEGGTGGHMQHLYENLSLTFQELLQVMHAAVNGFPGIEVTEKLDGQNIAISYDPDSGQAIALRTKGHAKLGGITKDSMRSYFTTDREAKRLKMLLNKERKKRYEAMRGDLETDGVSRTQAARQARAEMNARQERGEDPHGISDEEYANIQKQAKSMRLDSTPQGAGVVQAFFDSMTNFEEAVSKLPREMFVTEDGCRIFYNAEVMDPRSRNVVDYDTDTLVIHRVGHKLLCPPDGEESQEWAATDFPEAEKYSKQLDSMLSMHQASDASAEQVSKVGVNRIINFDKLVVDKEFFVTAVKSIEKIISDARIPATATIKDYISSRIFNQVKSEFPNATEEVASRILKAIIGHIQGRTPTTDIISKTTKGVYQQDPLYSTVERVLRNPQAMAGMLKSAIQPLENIIHDFGVGLLKGFESLYILNNMAAVSGLRSTVGGHLSSLYPRAPGSSVRGVQDGLSTKDMTVIKTNLRKISRTNNFEDLATILDDNEELLSVLNNISTAVEGLVFDFNGQTYKITGQFAPINQILGIGRYSRSESVSEQMIPDIEVEEEWEQCETIAIFPGGFKPPHAGHYLAAKHFLSKADKVFVVIGNSPRSDSTGKIQVTDDISKQLWDHYIQTDPDLSDGQMTAIAPGISPVRWLYDSVDDGTLKCGNTYIAGKGEKDASDRRFEALSTYSKKRGKNIKFQSTLVPPMADGVSGTQMRDMMANGDERLLRYLPPHLEEMPAEKKKAFLIMVGDPGTRIEPLDMDSMQKMISDVKESLFL